jgi:hypothetical protein
MKSLVFETQSPIATSDPNRADIACFVGFVRRRETPLPAGLLYWLEERGWINSPYNRSHPEQLLDLPIPLDSWELFDRLFEWEKRPLNSSLIGSTYLGAAVRSFFAQGGRRCYVIRVGDPWRFDCVRSQKIESLKQLIPGYPLAVSSVPTNQNSWQGVGHLLGLPDVSFVCLPDLTDAIAADPKSLPDPVEVPPPLEQFVECSPPPPELKEKVARLFQAPRTDLEGYNLWKTGIGAIADWLSRYQREVQLVAAVPLPLVPSDVAIANLGISSAFVQLAYPWVETFGSGNLPEQLESPDAVLIGILARNALLRGTFRSAANSHLADVQRLYPVLTREQLDKTSLIGTKSEYTLVQRVSILGETPNGLRLLSDVTTSLDESYRPASVNRLVTVIVRAARRLGEESVFEASGERLWKRLQDSLTGLMVALVQIGALRDTASPFEVVCDRRTMTQSDIDNGRVITRVEFEAAIPIERITVLLAMSDGGQISLLNSALVAQEVA